jgi:hypothetical protein
VTTQVEPETERPEPAAEREPGNTHGPRTGLTLFSPIRRQWAPLSRLSLYLGKWVPLAQDHILQFKFIHFVRWAIVRDMPYNGPPQPGRDRLNYPYLYFETNFDGPWRNYIDAFAYCIPADIRYLWGRGIAFPGPPPAEPLKDWIAANSMGGGTYYVAYPEASTHQVLAALAVRDGFRRLQEEARGLSADEFRAAYERFLSDVQAHL